MTVNQPDVPSHLLSRDANAPARRENKIGNQAVWIFTAAGIGRCIGPGDEVSRKTKSNCATRLVAPSRPLEPAGRTRKLSPEFKQKVSGSIASRSKSNILLRRSHSSAILLFADQQTLDRVWLD